MSSHTSGGLSPQHPSYPGPQTGQKAGGPAPGGKDAGKPQFGEVVTYTENGIEYAAITLKSRVMDSLGPDPLVHLLFVRPLFRLGQAAQDYVPVGTSDQSRLVQFRYDVLSDKVVKAVEEMQKAEAAKAEEAKTGKKKNGDKAGAAVEAKPGEKKEGEGKNGGDGAEITPEIFRTILSSTSMSGGSWKSGSPSHPPTFEEMIKAEVSIDMRIKMPRLKEIATELELAKEAIDKDKAASEEDPKHKKDGGGNKEGKSETGPVTGKPGERKQ